MCLVHSIEFGVFWNQRKITQNFMYLSNQMLLAVILTRYTEL